MKKIYNIRHYENMILLVKRLIRKNSMDEGTKALMEQRLEQYNILLENEKNS
tara:strand:+ start:530 stop:685 length:156 start_codon:yes stop_codon:yes gene_type:complete